MVIFQLAKEPETKVKIEGTMTVHVMVIPGQVQPKICTRASHGARMVFPTKRNLGKGKSPVMGRMECLYRQCGFNRHTFNELFDRTHV